ncbi:hypothetical protein [Limosilactobacillus coleohominis]|nr:hypothetical protein [Limosilactobacillus coleohominis]
MDDEYRYPEEQGYDEIGSDIGFQGNKLYDELTKYRKELSNDDKQ